MCRLPCGSGVGTLETRQPQALRQARVVEGPHANLVRRDALGNPSYVDEVYGEDLKRLVARQHDHMRHVGPRVVLRWRRPPLDDVFEAEKLSLLHEIETVGLQDFSESPEAVCVIDEHAEAVFARLSRRHLRGWHQADPRRPAVDVTWVVVPDGADLAKVNHC